MEEIIDEPRDSPSITEDLGQTETFERASPALGLEHRRRSLSRGEQRVQATDGRLGLVAKFGRKRDGPSLLTLGVKDRALRHGNTDHFFEAKGLGTKLNVVVIPLAEPASFVFDREGNIDSGSTSRVRSRSPSKLDEIGPPIKPKPPRSQPRPALGPHPLASLEPGPVGSLMKLFAASSVLIMNVQAVKVTKRGASIAIEQSIQGR